MTLERGSLKGRGLRFALPAIAVLAAALAAGAAAFLAGLEVSGEFLRAPIERALTAAFKVPTRIEGPLALRTGLAATVSADALVLADPSGPTGATLAWGVRPVARIDVLALLRRAVVLEEVTGERLELALVRRADGGANWAPVFARSAGGTAASVAFGGIERLRIGAVTGSYQREGTAPVPFAIASFDGGLPLGEPTSARGSVQVAGQPVAFDLRSASFDELVGSAAAIPVRGAVQWSGMSAEVKGDLARDVSRFDADVRASADDASVPLAALGVATSQPGRLDLRMRLGLTATEAAASDLTLTLGNSAASGGASVGWAQPRWRVAADIAGERIDVEPFSFAKALPPDKTAPEALVERLERTATGIDAEVRLAVGELAGVPVTVRELRLEGRSGEGVVSGRGSAVVSGAGVEARLDYDARRPQRSLAVRLDGGAVSTAALPREARPREVSGKVAGIRGELRARGENARDLVASVDADFEARDLRWTVGQREATALAGRFDRLRLQVQGRRASSVEVTGTLGDAACSLKISGGALAPLLAGEPWPLQIAGACPGGRIGAKGRLALAQRHVVGELSFDAAADRVGPVARALGMAPTLPPPIAARGTLVLDEKLAQARLAALRVGRSAGSGEVAFPLGADGAARVRLALATLDLDEIGAIASPGPAAGRGEREAPRNDLRLPDVDFDLAADRVAIADTTLRRLRFAGAVRAQKLAAAPFRFEWESVPIGGEFGADFGGAVPRVELEASARNADLRALLARVGYADVRLRASKLSLKARAAGERFAGLLAAATLDVALEGGQFDLQGRSPPGTAGRGEFSATLAAASGKPTTLAARGTIDGEAMDLAVETSALADFARAGAAIPVTARMTLGDARFDAAGRIARDGSGEGRLQVSGGRLDRLGRLVGMSLPEVAPYSASGNIVVSSDVVRADDVAASFGRSRLAGEVRVERRRGGRPRYFAELRVPALHLEDVGADHWLDDGGSAAGKTAEAPAAARGEAGIERGLDLLRAADLDVTLDVDALHGAGERYASGRLRARSEAGLLRAQLQDVRAANGGLDADIRVDASATPPKFGVQAQARDLEYGPLVRAVDPGSTAAGRLDLFADLAAQGAPANLLPTLTGTVDAAIYPRGLHSDGLALWGTGLLNAILGQLDPASRSAIECVVDSFDIGGGVATSTALFVDTPRVRIVGEFDLDLTSRALSGRIWPQSKQPQLLTFAPTMLLAGTLDSPSVRSAPENVVAVPLRAASSVASFAFDWLKARGPARAGSAGCSEAFAQIRRARAAAADAVPR